ncbi:hypothetical protein E1A91_A10G139600v1 [Gossypium mustelinum]|uniref:Uncharacterized protein n=1 Tax=Gossypium mustelinum TaxID=34275 RepID=A0A5D2XL76_GOSMU|nr:hypothetical protein E1A91_A10G139600v1 [Gossypium mustelinum]
MQRSLKGKLKVLTLSARVSTQQSATIKPPPYGGQQRTDNGRFCQRRRTPTMPTVVWYGGRGLDVVQGCAWRTVVEDVGSAWRWRQRRPKGEPQCRVCYFWKKNLGHWACVIRPKLYIGPTFKTGL